MSAAREPFSARAVPEAATAEGAARDRVLVLGASGYVGQPLLARLGPGRSQATYCRRPIAGAWRFDALAMDLAEVVEDPSRFSHAVILFADKNPQTCAADPRRSQALNVDAVRRVLERLRQWGVVPVFASTEFVFDGLRGGYAETDPPSPALVYGRQKLEVERIIQESFESYLIVRLAKVFGGRPGDGTLFTNWLDAIERGSAIRCAVDQVFTPVYVEDAVEGILRLMTRGRSGVYHVAGGTTASRAEFLDMFLEELRRVRPVRAEVVRCGLHELGLNERWPLDTSLDSRKLAADAGIEFADVRQVCRSIARLSVQEAQA